jgi:hypothetical protein
MRIGRQLRAAAATLLLLMVGAARLEAAAPRLVMFYGGPLRTPVLLADWHDNLRLVQSATAGTAEPYGRLAGRPYIRVAHFWGPEWARYVDEGNPLDQLRPEQGNEHGRFYPAFRGSDAVYFGKRLTPKVLAMLAKQGIPVRLPAR